MGDIRRIRALFILGIALLVAAFAAAPVIAKPPPKRAYSCTIGGYYADKIVIKSATTYKRFGKTGKYSVGQKLRSFGSYKGYAIKFKTGPMKGFKGNWHKTNPPGYELALKNPISGYVDTFCDD